MSYYRYPYRRYGRMRPRDAAAAAAVGLVLAAAVGAHHPAVASTAAVTAHAGPSRAAAVAIAYAEHQVGCPYQWGGSGPCLSGYDCSGLVMEAWAAAGVGIPRTTFGQWAGLRHVRSPAPGDLVLAPGSDGSWASPGHVGMYLGHGRVIQAYATGYPIDVVSLSEFGAGAGGIVGYAEVG